MLVLGRKIGQSFCIGDDIKIYLIETRGEYARIGIEAPQEVKILRQELIVDLAKPEDECLAATAA